MSERSFQLEALVDIPDDCEIAQSPIGAPQIDSMMARLRELGVERVIWISYSDGHGGWMFPTRASDAMWNNFDAYRYLLANVTNPLKTAVEAARRHGLDIYACFKPWEQGVGMNLAEGEPDAKRFPGIAMPSGYFTCMDPFVHQHPEMRIQRRRDDLPADIDAVVVHALELIKSDDKPTRVMREHLHVWESDDNVHYRPVSTDFKLTETIRPAAEDVLDIEDRVITRRGDPVRVLTLSGFDLRSKYIVVSTDFAQGPADFENAGTHLLRALRADGRVIPGMIGTFTQIWGIAPREFRRDGLPFDEGWNAKTVRLDEPTGANNNGVIGWRRGKNPALPLALCETEPLVREFWMQSIREIIATGVSGVDFRISSHCTHTDDPESYGYNDCVLERCRAAGLPINPANIARVRGEAYTEFLRDACTLLKQHGLKRRVTLHQEGFRSPPLMKRRLAYPGLITFPWRQWIDEGLLDVAILRSWVQPFGAMETDPVAVEMIEHCVARGVPLCNQRYLYPGHKDILSYPEMYERTRRDNRFESFCLYEHQSFTQLDASGQWQFPSDETKQWITAISKEHQMRTAGVRS